MLGNVILSVCAGFAFGVLGWMVGGPLLGLLAYAAGGAFALLGVAALHFAASRRPQRRVTQKPASGSPALSRNAR